MTTDKYAEFAVNFRSIFLDKLIETVRVKMSFITFALLITVVAIKQVSVIGRVRVREMFFYSYSCVTVCMMNETHEQVIHQQLHIVTMG